MVVRAGGYYRAPFRGDRGDTQGNPLSPIIFNVVVDTVVCHWESLLVAEREEREGGEISGDEGDRTHMAGRMIRDQDNRRQWTEEGNQRLTTKAEFFYANDGMVASTDPGWIHLAFDILMGLFDKVGLRTNVRKTVGMVCRNFWAAGVRAEEAYASRMTGEGRILKEREQERVLCPECGKELEKGSLVMHRQTQNGVAKGGLGTEGGGADGGKEPMTYRMAFPTRAGPMPFPVEG